MRSVLGVDGLLFRGLTRWWDLVRLSVGWFVLALGVITAPVATDWLLDGVRRTRDGQPIHGPRGTVCFVRRRFAVSSRLALLHLLVAGVLTVALLGPNPGGALGFIVLAVAVPLGVTWGLVAPWSVALLDQHDARAALRVAYLRALSHLSSSFLSLVAVIGGVALLVATPTWIRLPVLVTLPGAVAAVVTMLCDRAAPVRVSPATRTIQSVPTHHQRPREATS